MNWEFAGEAEIFRALVKRIRRSVASRPVSPTRTAAARFDGDQFHRQSLIVMNGT
ncbi:hypothetical protein [Micromonospora sp. NPDC049801]|uniref:hypothetical protein n=1 Tax=unclassified Micromonospora TaxID=2617518 RepID=UPI003406DB5F